MRIPGPSFLSRVLSWARDNSIFAVVLLSGILSCAAILSLLYSSLQTMTDKANDIAAVRDERAAVTLVDAYLARLKTIALGMEANPDGPGRGAPPKPPRGAHFEADLPVDAFLFFDSELDFQKGSYQDRPIAMTEAAAWEASLQPFLSANAASLTRKGAVEAGFVETPHGPTMVVAVSREAGRASGDRPSFVLYARHFTPALLGAMSETFRNSQLKILQVPLRGDHYIPLNDEQGHRLAVLSWSDSHPGTEAAMAARPQILQIGALMGLLILLLVGGFLFGLRRLSQSEKRAQHLSLTDKLSELPNRRALLDMMAQGTRTRAGRMAPYTIAFIDLDGFKDVNDVHGHEAGDELIVTLAKVFSGYLPADATLARLGGDEFALIVWGQNARTLASQFAQAVLNYLRQPVVLSRSAVRVGASIGLAHAIWGECDASEVFRRADMAMYRSKSMGKGRITEYDAAIDEERKGRQILEEQMRDGLLCDEFTVVYQPICHAVTHSVQAMEALVRWPHRPAGALAPDAFINVAETSGFIQELGRFVLRRACEDFQRVPDLRVHVNVSPVQFKDPDFESHVRAILHDTHFPPHRLELEITESHIIENPDRVAAIISSLMELGVTFSLDDFGAGWSGIGYLRHFPFNHVKIDRSIAGSIEHDPQRCGVLTGAIHIAHALNLKVIAEGVETEEQAELLRLAGCDLLQGYLLGRPSEADEAMKTKALNDRYSMQFQA